MRSMVFSAFIALFVGHGFVGADELPEITNSIGIKMKLIPAGTFTMGDTKGFDQMPHEVTLTQSFYLGVTEVTNAQGKRLMDFTPSRSQEDDHPIESVRWKEAVLFCKKLSQRREEREAGRKYRLPTEAEWEYACRAGSRTAYSFGDDESLLGDFGWFNGNSDWQPHPVGEKKPNAWGLYDMHGNVWEWCSDWYGEDADDAATDPRGPAEGPFRVRKGGTWGSPAGHCRSASRSRGRDDPWSRRDRYTGFRLALSPSKAKPPEAGK